MSCRLLIVGLLALAATTHAAAQATGVRYLYDALGRLVAVIDENGDAAIYTYDAVGNVLSILRRSAGDVMVVAFSPVSGSVGTTVTISGIGFSATPAENTVTFNGTAATVTSANANQLVVTVPAGATTGAIGVVTPSGTASSATAFVVSASVAAPTITSFTPTIGLSGAAVTVTGTGFDTIAANNRLTFNGLRVAAISGATATQLDTAVPPLATSGRLKVTTPGGAVTSADDFFVPPSPYTPSDVDATGRATFGELRNVTITTSGHVGLLVFDGAPGRRVSVVTGAPSPVSSYKLFHPSGALVKEGTLGSPGFIDSTTLGTAGTYTLLLDPNFSSTGTLPVTVHEIPGDATGTMTIGGAPVTMNITTPGQNGRVTFTGTAGQRIGVQASGVTLSSMYWAIVTPNGQQITQPFAWFTDDDPPEDKFLDAVLPVTGTYTLTFDPDDGSMGEVTFAAVEVPADVTGTIVPGGPPVTVNIPTAGQNARLTFTGTAGQRIALLLTDFTVGYNTYVSVLAPDGSYVMPSGALYSGNDYRDTVTLPANGTYTVSIDPSGGAVGNITATLYDVPADLTGTITIGGPSQAVTLVTGQNGTLTFSGTAGQVIALQMSSVTIAQSVVTIRNPNGSELAWMTVTPAGGAIVDKTLPTTGTYTIAVDPNRANAGGMTLTLSLAGDILGTITPGGPAVTVTITTPGQNARLSFPAAAGQRVSVSGTSITVNMTTVSILNPDGTTLGSTTTFTSGSGTDFLDTKTLPAAGTYTLFLDPSSSYTGSLTVTLHDVVDVTGPITMGGGTIPVTFTIPGQSARYTFTAAANQRVSVNASNVSGAFGLLALLLPDGTTHVSGSIITSSGRFLDATTLPVAGTYTVLVDPTLANLGTLNLALYDATDVTGTITAGGPAVPVTIANPGQNARLTFAGTSGQRVSVSATGVTISSSTTLAILNPDGSTLASRTVTSSGGLLEPVVLPASGTYTVLLDPSSTNTGAANLTLYETTDLTGTITPGGPAVTLTFTTPGQNARLTFEGTAAQRVSLRATNATVGSSTVSMLRPDQTTLATMGVTTLGGFLDTLALPETGTYTLFIDPSGTNTGNLTLTLYDVVDVTGTASIGGPAVPVTIATPGQNARLTFDGTAAQMVSVNATAVSIGSSTLAILKPDGTTLASRSLSTLGGLLEPVSLPVTGTYTLLLDPSTSNTGNATLSLHGPVDITGTITPGGAPVALTIGTPGQNARLTFTGAAAQRVSLRATSVTISSATMAILRPDGTTLASVTANTSGGFIDTQTLPVAGTYTVLVDPSGSNTGNITLTLYDVVDVTGTIAIGGPSVPVTIATPGQNARLTFEGTAAQVVSANATGVTIAGNSTLAILRPDGTTLASRTVNTSGGLLEPVSLPVSGTYTLLVDPSSANTGNITLALYNPNDLTGTITPGGAPVALTIGTPGQNARLTFTGAAAQRVSLRATSVTIASATMAILRPDGTTLASVTANTSGGYIDTQTLATAGTYTVLVDPSGSNTGNITLTLYDVVDVTGTIVIDGPAVPVTIPTPGQSALLTFDGVAGQQVSMNATSVTIGSSTTVAILRPDGTTLASRTVTTSGGLLDPAILPVTGTYTALANPSSSNTGNVTLRLHGVTDITGSIVAGGPAVPITITTPGQTARLTFSGTTGQRVSLRATSVTIASSTVAILRPDGTTLGSVTASTSGGFIDTKVLNVDGTHTVLVDPANANTGNMTLTLYDVPADVSGTLTVNGGGVAVTITTPGQNGALTFSGTAGQLVTVRVTGNTAGSTTVRLLRPDGTQQTSSTSSAANFNLSQQTLATTGTYTVTIDPGSANTGSLTIAVTNP